MIYHLPLDPTESLESLAQAYSATKCYPSDTLHECEVAKSKSQPSGVGGFGICWEGVFLGQHKVALKCPHSTELDRERKVMVLRQLCQASTYKLFVIRAGDGARNKSLERLAAPQCPPFHWDRHS